MSTTLKLFTCIVSLFFILEAQSQTFLGKKFNVDLGTTAMPNLLSPIFENENYFSKWSVFPTSLQIGVGYAANSRFNFRAEYAMHRPQIAGVRFFETFEYDGINQQYVDSFYFSSTNKDINFCVRIYQDFAPIGRYFTLFGGISLVKTRITPVTNYWNVTSNTSYFSNDRHAGIEVVNNTFRLGMGYGRTQLLTRSLYLDFGFRASLSFANKLLSEEEYNQIIAIANTPNYKQGYSLDYTPENSKIFSNGMRKNMLNTYLFEVYINFGLSL